MKTLKAMGINGSPRKNWNTATLIRHALDGAASRGAETETVHLYDLNFRGCISCFACKRKDAYDRGVCAMQDDLSPILERAMACDLLIVGSPVYLADVTGAMRAFIERIVFMNAAYDAAQFSTFKGRISCGFVYTTNGSEKEIAQRGYAQVFEAIATYFAVLNGTQESMTATDTLQFDDYAKYHAPRFDAAHKAKRHREQFPLDCEHARAMGARLADAARR